MTDEPEFLTIDDLEIAGKEYRERMDKIFIHEKEIDCISIYAQYQYQIELDRIPDMEGLLHWVHHLCGKPWMDRDLIGEFIDRICEIKGWNIHRRQL